MKIIKKVYLPLISRSMVHLRVNQSFDEKRITELLRNHSFQVSFLKIYALGAMVKVPLGRLLHFILKRLQFEFVGKTIVVVAQCV